MSAIINPSVSLFITIDYYCSYCVLLAAKTLIPN